MPQHMITMMIKVAVVVPDNFSITTRGQQLVPSSCATCDSDVLSQYRYVACLCTVFPAGMLEAIGYVAEEGGVTAPVKNIVNMARLFSGVVFGDKPVQAEDRIFGGR